MKIDRIAIIDLGSNTFHLLICEIKPDRSWAVIHKERVYVKLASGGLAHIDEESALRGLEALDRFVEQIRSYGVLRTRAIGTAALREAKNGREISNRFATATGLSIEIIDGQQEAGFILRGIKSCLPSLDRHGLIMDIGGGSVEFILFWEDKIIFKGSYKIGVAVLFRTFHHSDPMTEEETKALETFLDKELSGLVGVMKDFPSYYLIGASGSFEVINDVLPKMDAGDHWSVLDMLGMNEYLNEVIHTDMKSRRQIPEIPIERLDYIVVAYILIRFLVHNIPPEKLYYCDFALKEGVLAEMIDTL